MIQPTAGDVERAREVVEDWQAAGSSEGWDTEFDELRKMIATIGAEVMTEPSGDDADLREWFWRCALNLQNAAIKSTPQIAHPCDADHFADDAMRRIDALIEQRVAAAERALYDKLTEGLRPKVKD